MKLSKQSWHYRLVQWLPGEARYDLERASLCRYFWLVMFCLFVKLPLLTLVSPLICICIVVAAAFFWSAEKWQKRQRRLKREAGLNEWAPWPAKEKPYRESKPRKPSLIMAWLKAKKDKVCPIIDWEEE